MSKVVAIVLGRDGSKGIKNKNTMKLLGRKVFQYPIMAAIKSKFIDHIFVSTDIKDLIDYANDHNISILKRPKELATDSALFEDALLNAYFQIKDILNERPKYVVVLMANAVTVNYRLIDEAIELLEDNIDADSAVTVSDFNMYSPLRARKIGENGNLIPFVPFECFSDKSQLSCDRNSQGDVYFADMGHSVCRGTTPKMDGANNITSI